MSQEPEDVKPKLNLNIGYDGNQITVKVKANMKFAKIFAAAELNMEDGDQIDAFLEQKFRMTGALAAPSSLQAFTSQSDQISKIRESAAEPSKHVDAFYAIPRPSYDYLPYGPYETPVDFTSGLLEGLIHPDLANTLFAVYDKTKVSKTGDPEGAFAGAIGYSNGSAPNLALEIAWVLISPEFQRTHVTTNAIGLLLKYALDLPGKGGLGLRRVVWQCSPLNGPSLKAAERMGFKKEGYSRWTLVMPEIKLIGNDQERRAGDPKPYLLGRDTRTLAVCWDDWETGTSQHVDGLIARIA
ncbi:hypothetical protein DXG01_002669 [Tephrocybe rancida]|nr:hypothetical protein DXG01_002669 [Tephrocybe rancida]